MRLSLILGVVAILVVIGLGVYYFHKAGQMDERVIRCFPILEQEDDGKKPLT